MADVTAEGERAVGAGTSADTASQDVQAGPAEPSGAAPASPEIPPDTAEGAAATERAPRRVSRLLGAHWQFGIVIALAAALRVVVMLGYPPILWYSDSYSYITDTVAETPISSGRMDIRSFSISCCPSIASP